MFDLFRRAVIRIVQRLVPARGRHRQRSPVQGPFTRAVSRSAPVVLRTAHRLPAIRAEDTALIRPYVLSAEEWARRRNALTGAVIPLL